MPRQAGCHHRPRREPLGSNLPAGEGLPRQTSLSPSPAPYISGCHHRQLRIYPAVTIASAADNRQIHKIASLSGKTLLIEPKNEEKAPAPGDYWNACQWIQCVKKNKRCCENFSTKVHRPTRPTRPTQIDLTLGRSGRSGRSICPNPKNFAAPLQAPCDP